MKPGLLDMRLRKEVGLVVCSVVATLSSPALAQVVQTDASATPLPQPVGAAEFNLVTDAWAFNEETRVNVDAEGNDVNAQNLFYDDFFPNFENGDAITLNGLFKFRGEALDYVTNAMTAPGYFSPTCGFRGEILLRGGGCEMALGWYNIEDPNSVTPPAPSQIYPLVPQDTSEELDCQPPIASEFCPLAWDNHNPRELNKAYWTPKSYDSGLITQDANYKGGYIGFAMIGNPNSRCAATKYSLYGQNKKNANGVPWVTTLIYQSTADAEGFYLAFESGPMSTADWQDTGDLGTNDGDFNDAVFYVSGISCAGGGVRCDTGLPGACAIGRTDCGEDDGPGMCRPAVQPKAELCDNVDNDCNGAVDDGETLCADDLVCEQGTCVAACTPGGCPNGLMCSEGHCVDPLCTGISCDSGLVCDGGDCVDACDGMECPANQECQLGRCVDPCAGVVCPESKICERGLCVSTCQCRGGCDEGLECAADGRCVSSQSGGGGAPSSGGEGGVGGDDGVANGGEPSGNSGGAGNAAGEPNEPGSGGGQASGGSSTPGGSAGDGASSGTECTPGAQVACACAGTMVSGVQICEEDGSGFGACTGCPSSPDVEEESSCGCRTPGRGDASEAWLMTLILALGGALRRRTRSVAN
jgi:MYXO-CTERM domain-containing protein